jgi:hypothetical protein
MSGVEVEVAGEVDLDFVGSCCLFGEAENRVV